MFGGRLSAFAVEKEGSCMGACATSLLMWGKPPTSKRSRDNNHTLSILMYVCSALGG